TSRQLHRYGGGSLLFTLGFRIHVRRLREAKRVKADMIEKAFVLHGRDRLNEHGRQLGKSNRPPLLAIAADDIDDQNRFEVVSLQPGPVVEKNQLANTVLVKFHKR